MVLTSGFYCVKGTKFHLIPNQSQPSVAILTSATSPPVTTKFRRDKDSWLSLDDGWPKLELTFKELHSDIV